MTLTHLLYLHGFRSSPQSTKSRMVAERVQRQHPEVNWWCPQLPPSPAEAMAMIRHGTADWPADTMGVVGSSLGGFYATRLALERGCRSALLNPAVHPARDLAPYIGPQTSWHDPHVLWHLRPEHLHELRALESTAVPSGCLAIIAQGDEVLDWREMVARYPGVRLKLLAGSDHALSDFTDHMDDLLAHLQLA